MALLKYMKKYHPAQGKNSSEPEDPKPEEKLEFPIDPEFLSLPPRLDPQVMLRRLEETMPWRSTRSGEQERRLMTKIDVEFVL